MPVEDEAFNDKRMLHRNNNNMVLHVPGAP